MVVIGGLFTSTALTLVILPALYQWFAEKETGKEYARSGWWEGGLLISCARNARLEALVGRAQWEITDRPP
jgi:hypothetical protein